jgi:hypothetical protein
MHFWLFLLSFLHRATRSLRPSRGVFPLLFQTGTARSFLLDGWCFSLELLAGTVR